MTMNRLFTAAVVLSFLGRTAAAALLSGTVTDGSGSPVESAAVRIAGSDRGTYTDADGRFVLELEAAGSVVLKIDHVAFRTLEDTLRVPDGHDLTDLLFILPAKVHEMASVTVSAGGSLKDRLESYRSVSIIGSDDAVRSGEQSLGEMLSGIAGVDLIAQGPGISKPVIRGMTNQRVSVIDKGTKMEGQQWSSHHTPELQVSGNEHIEIIKGPASLLYGADAVGGVVQTVAEDPFREEGAPEGNSGYFRTSAGYNGLATGLDGGLIHKQDSSVTEVSGSWSSVGPYYAPGDLAFLEPVENTGFSRWSLKLGHWHKKALSTVRRTVSVYRERQVLLGEGHWHNTGGGPDGDEPWFHAMGAVISPTLHVSAAAEKQTESGIVRRQTVNSLQYNHRQGYPDDGEVQIDLETATASHSSRLIFPAGNRPVTVGWQLQTKRSLTNGPEKLVPGSLQTTAGIYGFRQRELGVFKLSWGLRSDVIFDRIYRTEMTSDYTVPDTLHIYAPLISGGAGLVWHPANRPYSLTLNAGTGFRPPSASERYIHGVHHAVWRYEIGDPDLKSEQTLGTELILRHFAGSFGGELSLFSSRFTNYIYPAPGGEFDPLTDIPIYRITQIPALIRGMEFSGYRELPAGFRLQLTASLTEGLILSETDDADGDGSIEDHLPEIPPARILLSLESGGIREPAGGTLHFRMSLDLRAAQTDLAEFENILSNDSDLDGINDSVEPQSYSLLNFMAERRLEKNGRSRILTLSLNNILNTRYYDHLSPYKGLAWNRGFDAVLGWSVEL